MIVYYWKQCSRYW